tara:strand:- start:321 stop:1379 length:1059 start_codon:yes stop_codon:yes gene_type:complete
MDAVSKKCVGLIFGGKSNEHFVSINSAKAIFSALKSKKNILDFDVKTFYIDLEGNWFPHKRSILILNDELNIKEFEKEKNFKPTNLFEILYLNEIDIWFPILHGLNGEDGTIQGLLKFIQKPYISSGVLGSAMGMDKITSKKIFSYLKIPQVNYLALENFSPNNNEIEKINKKVKNQLNFPLFIKPSNSGSSLGISKINNINELSSALKKAWEVDKRIIIEEGLNVRELECGIIGKKNLLPSEVGEIECKSEWYDYKSKYELENNLLIPALIDKNIRNQIQQYAIEGCKALNVEVFARVDFFLERGTNKIYLNEINTIPGFTNKSMFPLLWKASGLDIDQLVAKLINIVIES